MDLRRRLEALSTGQREALSKRLDELGVRSVAEPAPDPVRLVAYVAADRGRRAELRADLAERLPEHMQPSDLVVVEAFPRLPNTKVDRAALAAMKVAPQEPRDVDAPEVDAMPQPLLTSTQQSLLEVWSMILARTDIGLDDNFFDLGGHSVLATLAVSRIGQVMSVDLSLRALFERPTIGELSAFIDELGADEDEDDEPELVALPRRAPRRADASRS